MTREHRSAAAWGRIGGLTAWSRNDASTMVGPAHAGFRRRFANAVDPDGVLDPIERSRRADRAMRAHMLEMAQRSAAARRRVKEERETPSRPKESDAQPSELDRNRHGDL